MTGSLLKPTHTPKYSATSRAGNFDNSELLDYTFRNHKKEATEFFIPGVTTCRHTEMKIFNNKTVKVKNPELVDYMQDLVNTWTMNIDMISEIIKDKNQILHKQQDIMSPRERLKEHNSEPESEESLLRRVAKIKEIHSKKINLIKLASDVRGKMLITMQIQEEQRRISTENLKSYDQDLATNEELLEKKISTVNQNEKKFDEVEVYIQKECQDSDKYRKYTDFKVVPFLRENQDYAYKRHVLQNYINDKKAQIKEINYTNKMLKESNNSEGNKDKTDKIGNDNANNELQYKSICLNESKTNKSQFENKSNILITSYNQFNQSNHRKATSEFILQNTAPNTTSNRKSIRKIEKIGGILKSNVRYLDSLVEHKRLLLQSLNEKKKLMDENNNELRNLIRKSKLLTTRNATAKEINFEVHRNNIIDNIQDDQIDKEKVSKELLQNEKLENQDKRIQQLEDQINIQEKLRKELNLDDSVATENLNLTNIDLDKSAFNTNNYMTNASAFMDESFMYGTKKPQEVNEKWDLSIIHTAHDN